MLFHLTVSLLLFSLTTAYARSGRSQQEPLWLSQTSQATSNVSIELFNDLEEFSRIVDIAYCIGTAGLGIQKPFLCASRCQDFEHFELVKVSLVSTTTPYVHARLTGQTWNTGPLLADSCGYIALSHPPSACRIIVAFRGTYSVANTIIDLSTIPQEYVPYPGDDSNGQREGIFKSLRRLGPISISPQKSQCENCTVHAGFMASWRHTRLQIIDDIERLVDQYPDYQLTLVGHSLGGAVAALASLDFQAKGWNPKVTTFGEPRIGNRALMAYVDKAFDTSGGSNTSAKYRRVTHVDDPVPLLPLSEWGYSTHGGEIYISKSALPPVQEDLRLCEGYDDPRCIASGEISADTSKSQLGLDREIEGLRRWALSDGEFPKVPARVKIWQLFFAHRDYFWRLGLCIPGGDPRDWLWNHIADAG
ncbi:MAG: hypothetical protein Q9222_000114 [Ikaeria aurantiellina]